MLEKLMTIRACSTIDQASAHLDNYIKGGMKTKTAWDTRSTIQGVEAAKTHVALHAFTCSMKSIKEYDESKSANRPTIDLLKNLLKLYAVDSLLETANGLLELPTINSSVFSCLEELRESLLERMRPEMATLSEFMNFNEIDLRFSPLGRQDGKVYENLLEMARKNGFNQ